MYSLTKLILLAQVALGSVIPRPPSHVNDETDLLKRQNNLFVVSGASVNTTDGSIPPRLEIRQLQSNADLWNLYILGLSRFQKMNQQDKLSYYQLAGIHGRPWTSWDGVGNAPNMQYSGYCTHSNVLFASWHRPYLAVYEQVLYGLVQQVASEFPAGPTRDRYVAAANNFRIPYWDFAAAPPSGQSVLPPALTTTSITVTTPTGQQTIDNPLFSYKFNPLNQNDLPDQPFVYWQQTVRYPTSFVSMTATSQNTLVAKQLDNSRLSFRSRLFNLFSAYSNFNSFSNKAWIQSAGQGNFDSLESVHDQVHGLVGNGGHMSVVDYSAFDPIFWLHHTMIDRVFALWQAVYPDSYVQPGSMSWGTYAIPTGSSVDVNTALKPFHKDAAGNFWSSADVQSTRTFGYTYPELVGNQDPAALKAQVSSQINALYGSAVASTKKKVGPRSPSVAPETSTRELPIAAPKADTSVSLVTRATILIKKWIDIAFHLNKRADAPSASTHSEYIANLYAPRASLGQPVFVHLFLGQPASSNPADWSFDENLVGTHTFLVKNCTSVGGAACPQYAPDAAITGALPITSALLNCPSFSPSNETSAETDKAVVLPFLKDNLHYRVSSMDDKEVEVAGLKVTIGSATVTAPKDDTELPTWSAWVDHPEIVCSSS